MGIPIIRQPMGSQRDALVPGLSQQWQSEPTCSTVKTGYGMTRRAYFLETCRFENPAAHTICGMAPRVIEYHFFENSLVQVVFEFSESQSQENYPDCLLGELQRLDITPESVTSSSEQGNFILRYEHEDKQLELQVDEALRTVVSEIDKVKDIQFL